MADIWSSNGNNISRIYPPAAVWYPISETVFLSLKPGESQISVPLTEYDPTKSLFAQMLQLNTIFAEISQYTKSAINDPNWDPEDTTFVDKLSLKLDGWYEALDPAFKDTQQNMEMQVAQGSGPMFVALYLGFYHFGFLLYYQFLHSDSYRTGYSLAPYAAKCRTHSTGLCDILYRSLATPGAEVYYPMVGHVLVIASTIQLHILLFGTNEVEIAAARGRLEKNFKILTELQYFWPTMDASLTRFTEFHKACQESKESSFKMDRWMLKFLLEFGKPVEKKVADPFEGLWALVMQDSDSMLESPDSFT